MKIISLEIENILSIEKASVSFEDSGLVLVEGWNYDTARANGAGKTAIFNSLSFGLFDKLPRKVTASEILRRGCNKGKVTVVVQLGDEIWTVSRSRPKGVSYSKDSVPQLITQEEFESKLRFNYNQFLLSMYTSQHADGSSAERFLLCNDSDKKTFLLNLLNLERFADCKKATDDLSKEILSKIDQLSNSSINALSKIDAYSESLVDEDTINSSILSLNSELSKLNSSLVSLSHVVRPDLAKYSKIEEDLYRKQAEISSAKVNRSMWFESYKRLSSQVSDYDKNHKCDQCGSSLDSEQAQTSHASHQNDLEQQIKDAKLKIDETDAVIAKESAIKELSRKVKEKKTQESADYLKAQEQINDTKTLINRKTSLVDNLTLKLDSNLELTSKIKALRETLEKLEESMSSNKKDLEVLKTVSGLFSPTGAQAYVLDSVIDSFNEAVSAHISVLWPNATYSLNSYKENSKGDVVAKFSEVLTMNGKEISVGSLSGGELRALSLCVDFAILDVLQSQFGLYCNPIILDEPFNGLDSTGRELVIDLLEKFSRHRQVMIVDHSSEAKAMFSKFIMVEKRNSISMVSVTT